MQIAAEKSSSDFFCPKNEINVFLRLLFITLTILCYTLLIVTPPLFYLLGYYTINIIINQFYLL